MVKFSIVLMRTGFTSAAIALTGASKLHVTAPAHAATPADVNNSRVSYSYLLFSFSSPIALITFPDCFGEAKRENLVAGGNGDILPSVRHVSDWRSHPGLSRVKVPQCPPGFGIGCRKASSRLAINNQVARRGKHAGIVSFRRPNLPHFPGYPASLDLEGAKIFFGRIGRVGQRHVSGPALAVDVTVFHSHDVK